MAAYVIVDILVQDPATYERYKALAPATIAAYGGRYLVRGGATETLEGSWVPNRVAMLEFESVDRAKEWWSSPEYEEAKALRVASTRTNMILVEGICVMPT